VIHYTFPADLEIIPIEVLLDRTHRLERTHWIWNWLLNRKSIKVKYQMCERTELLIVYAITFVSQFRSGIFILLYIYIQYTYKTL